VDLDQHCPELGLEPLLRLGCNSGGVHIDTAQDALGWLGEASGARRDAGVERALVPRPPGVEAVLDLASNDYLALARHPAVVSACARAAEQYGAGATGSRLVTGTTALHEALEQALAAHVGAATALVFSSGYLANLGAVTALSGPGTLVVSDAANHASLVDACRLSRARLAVVPHGRVDCVERALAQRAEERALVVTDAVFSASGRLAPLVALHEVARRNVAVLLIDEAHSVGVVGPAGRGAGAAVGLAGERDVVITATLSKAFGSSGGVVLGSADVRQHLISTARSFIFDTGLAPPSAGAALAGLHLTTPGRVGALQRAAHSLADALQVPRTDSAVVPVHVGDARAAAAARDLCLARGVRVGCFRPPSVPQGQACLRLTARADLTTDDIALAAQVVRESL
jgi:8-amino-7-oxononanoate synthase